MTHKILAVCLDCGDTLIDEGTEVRDAEGIVVLAQLIPGAAEMVRQIKQRGYPLALVADGYTRSFQNILGSPGLYNLFDAYAISDQVGVEKPDPAIFHTAMQQLRIEEALYGQVIMLGNNLSRDVLGANALGMISAWIDWAPRRSKIPENALETPDYTVKAPIEFIALLDEIEKEPEHPPQ